MPTEDNALALAAETAIDSFSAEEQALLRPFLLRPTHPESYWTADPASQPASGAPTAARGARLAAFVNDPRCTHGAWARRDLVNIPVTIWGRCRVGAGGTTLGIEAEMTRAAALLTRVYGPMVALMGPPTPDQFRGQTQAADEVTEAGDGRLDVYLIEAPNLAYDRVLDVSHSGANARQTSPTDTGGGPSAGYITMDVTRRTAATDQEATMAHELFHVLQSAHNALGTVVCPYPSTASGCGINSTHHWFVEASAQWAVHEFLPTHRFYVYSTFERFRISKYALASTDEENEYYSFMWPLFMEQETLRGPDIVGDAWVALEGKSGWLPVQAALDGVLSFKTSFRDFAVRVWNEQLEPGDPISPRFNHANLDAAFPKTRADDDSWLLGVGGSPRPAVRFLEHEVLLPDRQERFTVDLPELWAGYYRLDLPPLAGRLTLNFAGLTPNSELDVDALVRLRDGNWERRKLDPTVNDWCLDKPADAIEDLILVLSNHSQTPNTHVKGDWTVEAELGGCSVASDGLHYTFFSETGSRDSFYQSLQETLTLRVSLKSSPTGVGFVDAGSTWRGGVDTMSFLAGLPGSGCNLVAEGHGGGGGPIPVDKGGGISGGIYEDVIEPPPGSTSLPQRRFILSISASVPMDLTTTEESCIGVGGSVTTHVIQLPDCDGTEIEDTAAGLLFDFNCSFQGTGVSWSLTGKIRIAT